MDKTMIELFAGVGGFRCGFEKHGWKTIWANQWEPATKIQHAYEVYTANFGKENVINEDINTVDKTLIPDHTLLVGGFPCQDYSVARTKAKGIQGKKGVLWWNIADILKVKRPKFVLLENVDRLIKSPSSQRGRDFGIMLRTFFDIGYSLEWRVINAAEYGFPQRRRRVFMFASLNSTNYFKTLETLEHNEIINYKGFFNDQFKLNLSYNSKKKPIQLNITNYKDLVDVSDNFESTFYNSGVMIKGNVSTFDTKPIECEITPLKDILETQVDSKYFIDTDTNKLDRFKFMKGAKKEKRIDSNGYEYFYSEGSMSFPDKSDLPARTILTSEASVNRSSHVIQDLTNGKFRLLTPIECERLNGFSDNWTNPAKCSVDITDRKRYFFMGNALVVGVIDRLSLTLNGITDKENY